MRPTTMAATTRTAGGTIIVSGVRALPPAVSLVSSAASLAICGSSAGGSAEALDPAPGPPRHGPAAQAGAGDQDGDEPGPGAGLDPALAEERGERRQVGQPESGQREDHSGAPQRPAAAVQRRLVDRAEPVQ